MKVYNNYKPEDVTVVVCAYKTCEYLEESIKSVLNQSVKPNVVISTSTPNEFIQGMADKYNLPVWINNDGGHAKDYNFAIHQTKTKVCIMAHQDDLLHEDFVKESLRGLNEAKNPIIAFTDYKEIHGTVLDKKDSKMVKIKRLLLTPVKGRILRGTKLGKFLCLCFGDPITHPSVTYVCDQMPDDCFREQYKSAMDWDLWERLSKQDGDFVYVNKILFFHRMHEGTQTAKLIEQTNDRYNEDFEILNRFWPKWITKFIMHFYSKAQSFY